MKDVCLELKVCEGCGALHLRAANRGTGGALHLRAPNQGTGGALHLRAAEQGDVGTPLHAARQRSLTAGARRIASKPAYCAGCAHWLADCPLPARSQVRYGRGVHRPQAVAAARCAGGAR